MRRLILAGALLLSAGPAMASLDVPPIILASTATSISTPTAASSLSVSGTHTLLGLTITAPSSGYAMAFDATSAPADGTVSPPGCWYIPPPISVGQSATISMANTPTGVQTTNGITIVFSTTGCFTKTAAPAFISMNYQ